MPLASRGIDLAIAVCLDQRTTQGDSEINAARGERSLAIDSLKHDPFVREDAARASRIVLPDWLAVPLRASRENARVDRLMSFVGFFEPLQLPRSDDTQHIFAGLVGHQ